MSARMRWCLMALLFVSGIARAATSYTLDPEHSTMQFMFVQAGARSEGAFKDFAVDLTLSDAEPKASRLEVAVNVDSLDTGDEERDDVLRGADLFDARKFPTARFVASQVASAGVGRYVAVGNLTIRGITRVVRIPFTFRRSGNSDSSHGYMQGAMIIKRLQFGVGQGEWRATDFVADEVEVSFALRLVPAKTS